ncbi:MAG: type II and III secretion system protein family protein [Janthinobacterium lividum]
MQDRKVVTYGLTLTAGCLILAVATAPGVFAQTNPAALPADADFTPIPQDRPAHHQSRQHDWSHVQTVSMDVGSGQIIHLSGSAANVFAADPKVAEVRPAGPTTLFIFGLAVGRTTIAAMNKAGQSVGTYQVTVNPSSFTAAQAGRQLDQAEPGANMTATANPSGIALEGTVPTAADAERAVVAARSALSAGQTVDNRLSVAAPVQVLLRVRVAEMSRTLTRDLGLNWQQLGGDLGAVAQVGISGTASLLDATSALGATAALTAAFKKTNVEAVVDALAEDQLIHTLAEPNLTAMSGEAASFLVGGEYPVPIAQQLGQTTVEYKQYGISLSFVPTVMSDGRINLRVRPEVSALTNQGAVSLQTVSSSLVIPALTVRRVETTIELGSGQSFAIAGLLQDQVTQGDLGTPFLGDVPILGALFRSDSFKRQQTELVILVTPYIIRPVSSPTVLHVPGENYQPPGDLERLLLLRQTARGGPARVTRIPGDAGFLLE